MLKPILVALFVASALATDKLKVAFQWQTIRFDHPDSNGYNDALMVDETFIPEHNLPLGLEVHKDRLFITLPRLMSTGVPATLAYIRLSDDMNDPLLRPYPNWQTHQDLSIVSPFRVRADNCERLWVLDSGLSDMVSLSKPRLLIYDLRDDTLLRNYTIPDDQQHQGNGSVFANIVVEENNCDDSFAYLADMGHPALVVYSYKENRSWLVKHHYFQIDPLAGNMNVSGITSQWSDGLLGMALSKKDGLGTLYFHPMASFNEFTVNTQILQDESLATNSTANFHAFKFLGSRGNRSESGASFLDQKTDVLFYSLLNINAVACWRTTNPNYTMESQGRVFKNDYFAYPSDLKVDSNDVLWVLFNNYPSFKNKSNYQSKYYVWILNATVSDAIKGTACDSKIVVDPTILTKYNSLPMPKTKVNSGGTTAILNVFGIILISLLAIFNH